MNLLAAASTSIKASVNEVWNALTDPAIIKQYMFGTTVTSDWMEGSNISWQGEWKGKPYEDKGKILKMIPGQVLQYSHFSPLSGQDDIPQNYHTVTISIKPEEGSTKISLTQDNNHSEEAQKHAADNWSAMLASLKKLLEQQL